MDRRSSVPSRPSTVPVSTSDSTSGTGAVPSASMSTTAMEPDSPTSSLTGTATSA